MPSSTTVPITHFTIRRFWLEWRTLQVYTTFSFDAVSLNPISMMLWLTKQPHDARPTGKPVLLNPQLLIFAGMSVELVP